MDNEERESGGPPVNDLFDMVETQASTPAVGRGGQPRGCRILDTEDIRFDVDLVVRPETKEQFVMRRRTKSPLRGSGGRGSRVDAVLYKEGVDGLELNESKEAFECLP